MDNVGGHSCHAAAAVRCLLSLGCVRRDVAQASAGAPPARRALARVLLGAGDGLGPGASPADARAGFAELLRLLGAGGPADAHETLAAVCGAAGLDRRFEGEALARTACGACGNATTAREPFSFLVSAGAAGGDLSRGLGDAFRDETVAGYDCDACGARGGACRVSRRVSAFPEALAVRCMWAGAPGSTSAPLAVDLSGCAAFPAADPAAAAPATSLLRSAVLHSGSAGSGHYRAVCVGPWGGPGGPAATLHDDGDSRPAPPGTVEADGLGRPRALRVPGAQLHTAVYEAR